MAREKSELLRSAFISTIGSKYRPDQLIFIDESSKDERTLNRTYGYSNRGCQMLFFYVAKDIRFCPHCHLMDILL